MKFIIRIVPLLIFSLSVGAQESIDVQRPTMTESNTVISPKMIQAENGSVYSNDSMSFNTFVRFGVTERLEFRVASSFDSPFITFGGKVFISEGKKALPGLSFAMDYSLLKGTQNYVLSATGAPTDNLFYTLNFGNDRDWWGIVLLGYSLGKAAIFGEYKLHENYEQINAGITYIIKGEVQLDVHGGLIDYKDPYVGAGFAFRLKPFRVKAPFVNPF